MYAWEQIQKTVDYIENHLREKMEIEELAAIAALSPFYFQRLFGRLVQKPVAEYIKLRRMALAMEELRVDDKRILDIAVALGFTSHEHFTRTFKKTFGITPEAYRKNPRQFNHMTKPELLLNYVLVDEGVPVITEGIVLEVVRQTQDKPQMFVGMEKELPVTYLQGLGVESGEDPLDVLWNSFHENKGRICGVTEQSEEVGVTHAAKQEGYFAYFAGASTAINGGERVCVKQSGLETWELPMGEYLVCSFEAENFEMLVMDALYKAEQYLYKVWLPNHKIRTEPFCIERYASHGAGTTKMEVWLKVME